MRVDGGGGANIGPGEAGAGQPAGKNEKFVGFLPTGWRGTGWRMATVLHDEPSTGEDAMVQGGEGISTGGGRAVDEEVDA